MRKSNIKNSTFSDKKCKSGWGYTIRVDGLTVHEASAAVELTTSSMIMEVKVVTETLEYIQAEQHKRAFIVTDFMSSLQKITSGFLYADWVTATGHHQQPPRETHLDLHPWSCWCTGERTS